jgi:hypothetical protein
MRIRLLSSALAATATFVAACGHSDAAARDSAASTDTAAHTAAASGSVAPASDSTGGAISANIQAIGPGIQVTSTDQHNVNRAFDYKVTADSWSHFLAAADSVAALRARDADVRQYLDSQIVGAKTDDAGQKWLEANPRVSAAITGAGITVKDYYRLGIVTAYAMRFMNDPKSAPPTAAGNENAQFLRNHPADLEHLRTLSQGGPSARTTPQ